MRQLLIGPEGSISSLVAAAVMGRFADVVEHPAARVVPGVVVYRLDDRLFFANAGYVKRRIREAVRGAPNTTRWLVLDAESIAQIDTTGIEALRQLVDELHGCPTYG